MVNKTTITLLKINTISNDAIDRNHKSLGSRIRLLRISRYLAIEIKVAPAIKIIPAFTRIFFCQRSVLNHFHSAERMKICMVIKKIRIPIIDNSCPCSVEENLKK